MTTVSHSRSRRLLARVSADSDSAAAYIALAADALANGDVRAAMFDLAHAQEHVTRAGRNLRNAMEQDDR